MSKIIAVHGATGLQGGSVVKALQKSDWKVRAITRNPSSDSAKALTETGVEVVAADFDNEDSLKKAYEGVEAIFLVTNYWEHLFTGKSTVQSGEAESAQALTVVKIAAELPTLKHFIWSTLPGNAEGQPKRQVVHHFDFKAQLDVTIRKEYPDLAAKTTYLYVGFYANNFVTFPNFKPFSTPGSYGVYYFLQPVSRTTVYPSAGDTSTNVGIFAKAILAQPEKTQGKYVAAIVDEPTGEQLLESWTKATGKPTAFFKVDPEDWIKAFGGPGEELYGNLKAFEDNPKWAFDNSPLSGKDLGIEGELVSTEAYLESVKDQLLQLNPSD